MPVSCSTKCVLRLTLFFSSLKSGGLAEEVDEKILHAAFVPFGDIKDVKTPLDMATQKHR
jgi:RNA recognition motif. (a.k.a. RRM, RBD, or RNP domain)